MANQAKLLTVNVRGLSNPIKHKRILLHIIKSHPDIVFLQETHIKDPDRHPIPGQKFPNYFTAHGSSKSRGGVVIFLANM